MAVSRKKTTGAAGSKRTAAVARKTGETDIRIRLDIDGTGKSNINTGIGFFDHMLSAFSKHGFFDLECAVKGDLYVDGHHSVEDCGIVLGEAIKKAVGEKKGINRYGYFILPMDEVLVLCSLDLCDRPFLGFEYEYKADTLIPSKTSITAIAHKNMEEARYNATDEIEVENYEEDEITFPVPKFLNNEDEEKITASKRGTIMHLCMKNLDFSKEYEIQDVKNLVEELKNKDIITEKEANSVNINQILKFTKSDVWEELKSAKEYHKEEPFYINVPASKVQETESTANILAQGIIDLYYIDKSDNLVLLDYKTDYVTEGEEDILIKRHTPQLLLYKEALVNALNGKVDRIYIYSTVLGKKIEIST